MIQQYENYTSDNQATWKKLFERQEANLRDKASVEFLLWLNELSPALESESIPSFRELNHRLWAGSGWSIEVVPGLIPVSDFFKLLARRRFCSSTWIRRPDQLDYLEEPDMFHDIFGHVPMLMNPTFADFMQKFGEIGMKFVGDKEAERKLERLYWFTVEFGMIQEHGQMRVYGAGIASSFGETNHIFGDGIDILPFDLKEVMEKEFQTDVMQTEYYAIPSYESLYRALDGVEELLSKASNAVSA
jgi:phenylalanine-4-hydroxylase